MNKWILYGLLIGASACVTQAMHEHFEGLVACSDNCPTVEWVAIDGDGLALSEFEIMKTEVTVGQYLDCVDAKVCYLPMPIDEWSSSSETCFESALWLDSSDTARQLPVNCLPRRYVERFARWLGGRLPTREEWIHVATSERRYGEYPWGDEIESVACDWAVVYHIEGTGCGLSSPHPTCSKPRGDSDQGVCDLIGNVAEMIADSPYALGADYTSLLPSMEDYLLDPFSGRRVDDDDLSYFVGFRLVRN